MSEYAKNKITSLQYILINTGMQVSVFFLALPRILFEEAGTDGWISLIIGWIITMLAGLAIIKVMSRQPDGTLLDLITRYAGKWAGRAAAIALSLYLFYFAYSCLIQTTLITKEWLLPQTSAYLIVLLLLIPTYIIAVSGIRVIGRYAEITSLLSLWIPFVYLLPLKEAHWLHLFPIAGEGLRPIGAGIPFALYCFLGFVTSFVLYPYLQNQQQASKAITISNTLTLLVHLFVTLVCYMYFSPDEIASYNEPAINVLRIIEFKFVERIEVIFIALYLFIFSLSWIPAVYLSAYCTKWLTGMQSERNHFRVQWLMLAVISYFFIPTLHQNEKLERVFLRVGIGVEYAFPFILFMCFWLLDRFSGRKRA